MTPPTQRCYECGAEWITSHACPIQNTVTSIPQTINLGPVHVGGYVWKNGAELLWECAENCPHPDHDAEVPG